MASLTEELTAGFGALQLPTEEVGVIERAVANQYPQRAEFERIGLSLLQYRMRGL